mmetsp:Transcript_116110/g.335342  ORF Transcript_116110/g.335342 Transcript_116110/m.335342 type:complete len:221 (+) Transcript_116110:2019-2681(+)
MELERAAPWLRVFCSDAGGALRGGEGVPVQVEALAAAWLEPQVEIVHLLATLQFDVLAEPAVRAGAIAVVLHHHGLAVGLGAAEVGALLQRLVHGHGVVARGGDRRAAPAHIAVRARRRRPRQAPRGWGRARGDRRDRRCGRRRAGRRHRRDTWRWRGRGRGRPRAAMEHQHAEGIIVGDALGRYDVAPQVACRAPAIPRVVPNDGLAIGHAYALLLTSH